MATLKYPDSTTGAWKTLPNVVPDAPKDGYMYARMNGQWVRTTTTSTGYKNKIINPHGFITRRAGENTNLNGSYICDRWRNNWQGATYDNKLVANSINDSDKEPWKSSPYHGLHMYFYCPTTAVPTVAAGAWACFGQGISPEMLYDLKLGYPQAKPMVLSFVACASHPMVIAVSIQNGANTRSCVKNFAFTVTPTRYEFPIPPAVEADPTVWNANALGAQMLILFVGICGTTYQNATQGAWVTGNFLAAPGIDNLASAAGRFFRVNYIMLEEGTKASPFEERPASIEQILCERYWQKSYGVSNPGAAVTTDCIEEITGAVGGQLSRTIRFPTSMIKTPSMNVFDTAGNLNKVTINGTTSNVTPAAIDNVGVGGFKVFHLEASTYRLSFHWKADAEIF